MMSSLNIEASQEIAIARLRRHSWLSALVMVVAVVIILGAALFTAVRFSGLQQQVKSQEMQLNVVEQERLEAEQQLDEMRDENLRVRQASEFLRRGLDASHAGEYEAAVSAYERAMGLDPHNPMLYELRGEALLLGGEVQQAVDSLEVAVVLQPDYIEAHYHLALAYWALGDRDRAVQEVEKVLELDPEAAETIASDSQFLKFRTVPEFRELM